MHLLTISRDQQLAESLRSALGEKSCELLPPDAPGELLPRIQARAPDAVLYDASTDPASLGPLLTAYTAAAPVPPLLVLLPHDRRDQGLTAVRDGAFDYLLQPLAIEELALRIRRAQELSHARQEATGLRTVLDQEAARGQFVAESPAMLALRERAGALAAERRHVLIRGEAGTGRKTLAEFLHRSSAGRRAPLRLIPCAELSADTLEAMLFRRPGPSDPRLPPPALEGEPGGATVVLEGIDRVPARLQERIADFLREQDDLAIRQPAAPWICLVALGPPVDAVDSNAGLSPGLQDILEGAVVEVPPLRDRPQDIAALLAHFAQRAAQRLGRPVSVSPRALAMLAVHGWPGNVRELEAAVNHAARLAGNGRLEYADFGLMALPSAPPSSDNEGSLALKPQVEAFERQVIMQALTAAKGSRRTAARLLGISLRTLFYKIRRYGLERARPA